MPLCFKIKKFYKKNLGRKTRLTAEIFQALLESSGFVNENAFKKLPEVERIFQTVISTGF